MREKNRLISFKVYVFICIFLSFTPLAFAEHMIFYGSSYRDAALRLQALCNSQGLDTKIRDIASVYLTEPGTGAILRASDPVNTDPKWTEKWNFLLGQSETGNIVEPRRILYYTYNSVDMVGVQYLTLLGSGADIPPSKGFVNLPVSSPFTDYHYSLNGSGTEPDDLLPDRAVTRFPIKARNADDVTSINILQDEGLPAVIPVSAIGTRDLTGIAANEYTGFQLSYTVRLGANSNELASTNKVVREHTAIDEFGRILFVLDDPTPVTVQSATYPFIAQYNQNQDASKINGNYLVYSNGTPVDAVEPFSVGKNLVLLNKKGKVQEVGNFTISSTQTDLFFIESSSTLNTTYINNALSSGNIFVIVVDKTDATVGGQFFVIDPNTDTSGFGTSPVNHFKVLDGVGNNLPALSSTDFDGKSAAVYEFTNMNSLLNTTLGGGISLAYIENQNYVDQTENVSLLQSNGYLMNLGVVADQLAQRVVDWANQVLPASENPNADYFHNLLAIAHGADNRWDYNREKVTLKMLNAYDKTLTTASNVSLTNGYNVTKYFETNSGDEGMLKPSSTFPSLNVTSIDSGTASLLSKYQARYISDLNGFGSFTLGNYSDPQKFNFTVAIESDGINSQAWSPSIDNTIDASSLTPVFLFSTSYGPFFIKSYAGQGPKTKTVNIESLSATILRTPTNGTLTVNLQGSAVFASGTDATSGDSLVGKSGANITMSDGKATFVIENEVAEEISIIASLQGSTVLTNLIQETNSTVSLKTVSEAAPSGNTAIFSQRSFAKPGETSISIETQVIGPNGRPYVATSSEASAPVKVSLSGSSSKETSDAFFGKGVVLMNDDWNFFLGNRRYNFGFNDIASNTHASSNLQIPITITSGIPGFSLSDEVSSILSSEQQYLDFLFGSEVAITGNTGILAAYGPQGERNVSYGLEDVEGQWDKGVYTPFPVQERHKLAQIALNQYTVAAQPRVGNIWRQTIEQYLKENSTNNQLSNELAITYLGDIEGFSCLGLSGLRLPTHKLVIDNSSVPPKGQEQEIPSVIVNSTGLRAQNTYDRYNLPVIEVERGATVDVTVSLANASKYSSGTNFRYTLVSMNLMQPYTDSSQWQNRIAELDFDGSWGDNIVSFSTNTQLTSLDYKFYSNWENNSNGMQRGPGLFMVRVEVEENQKLGDSFYASQKKPYFNKEKRIFFRIVNKFEYDTSSDTQFLLVNNTDHDQYRLNPYENSGVGLFSVVPNPAIRFYEHALDNYQYTHGLVSYTSVTDENTSSPKFTFTADNSSFSDWGERIVVGDKIRLYAGNVNAYTNWHRITAVTDSTVTFTASKTNNAYTDTVFNSSALDLTNNFKSVNYMIQRSFTSGYAEMTYTLSATADPHTAGADGKTKVTIVLPKGELGFSEVVQAGDFFKFLDERTYMKIESISGTTLTLTGSYKLSNVYQYYNENTSWGGNSRLPSTGSTIRGSYAIYPANNSNVDLPNYLYQTWNTHNYTTANGLGQGVHGDVTGNILSNFAQKSKTTGKIQKVVVWANDAGLRTNESINFTIDQNRDRTALNDDVSESETIHNDDELYLSEIDKTLLSSFLSIGGRLFTGGQFVQSITPEETSTHAFFNTIGVETSGTSSFQAVESIAFDPVSDEFFHPISLNNGFAEGFKKNADDESMKNQFRVNSLNASSNAITVSVPSLLIDQSNGGTAGPELVAAVRTVGGVDTNTNENSGAPYASYFIGFDFSNVHPAGAKNIFKTFDDSTTYGRNLLMKQVIDWLRDPTRTSDLEALRVTFHGTKSDGTKQSVVLDKSASITLDSSFTSQNSILTVGPNQELEFEAAGGVIDERFKTYTWRIEATESGLPSLRTNGDNSQTVFYKTGGFTGTDTLSVTSPDGSVTKIFIVVNNTPVFLNVDNDGVKVKDNSVIYQGGQSITITAQGGDGLDSYTYSIVEGLPLFTSSDLISKLDSDSAKYTMPIGTTITADVQVNFLVTSGNGSKTATASLTIKPNVFFDKKTISLVAGGVSDLLSVGGGDGTYTYVASSNLLNLQSESTGVKVNVPTSASTNTLSTNPASPVTETVTVTSFGTTDTATVSIYNQPFVRWIDPNTNTSSILSDTPELESDSNGYIFLNSIGGGPDGVTWTVDSVSSSNIKVYDISKVTNTNDYTNEANRIFTSANSQAIAYNDGQKQILIDTNKSTGVVTISAESGGVKVTKTINFSQFITVSAYDETEPAALNNTDVSGSLKFKLNHVIKLSAPTNTTDTYTWSYSTNSGNNGLGFMSTLVEASAGTTEFEGSVVYFHTRGATEGSTGSISVVDQNKNKRSFFFENTNFGDPLVLNAITTTLKYPNNFSSANIELDPYENYKVEGNPFNKSFQVGITGGFGPYSLALTGISGYFSDSYGGSDIGTSVSTNTFYFVAQGRSETTGSLSVTSSDGQSVSMSNITVLNNPRIISSPGSPSAGVSAAAAAGGGCFINSPFQTHLIIED